MGERTLQAKDPIAIIGMGCRFPGNVTTLQEFWDLLIHGADAVRDYPVERGDIHQFYHPDPNRLGKIYTRQGGFLEGYDLFDPGFFGISALEAKQMDPQQRLLLETSWEALEDAGVVPSTLAGSQTGVFVGMCSSDYAIVVQRSSVMAINAYTNAGGERSIAANRLSYLFDFRGPSMSIDTACSSSLVGLHLACESLRKGECTLALAAGVNIVLDPRMTVGFCQAHMLSPGGRCRTFDAGADGYVRGEGAGVVVLKPLAQALADGNPIYACILATGINQDGKTPGGMVQPGRASQEALLRHVYEQAGIAPHQVQYVEAHGTGTPVGDPIECTALGNVLGKHRPAGEWLHIGSVKTNIGHLEGGSGIAGLIKAALALKHRQIPPNLHFQTPNPQIAFEELHLKVPQTTETLPTSSEPLVVGVNNFGFGGTNAHVVLQEFSKPMQQMETTHSAPIAYVLPLSARSPEALRALAHSYEEMLRTDPIPALRDLCRSASMHREHHPYRLGMVIQSHEDLLGKLAAFLAEEKASRVVAGTVASPNVAFVFSGNGQQWWAMGQQLLEEEPLFRTIIVRCDQELRHYSDWSLLEELQADEVHSHMQHTNIAQPALFALQIALVAVLQSWGIEPQVVIGHSVGEIAAAYVAGILSFEDAIKVIFHRSRLQELTAGKGKMLAVALSEEAALKVIALYKGKVSLASINSPDSVTLTGEEAALQEIMDDLEAKDVFYRSLQLNYAFHSHIMDPAHQELLRVLHDLRPRRARIPFVSTVAGRMITGEECVADYWWNNIRQPVQFAAGIQQMLEEESPIFLEIGPHPALSAYIVECATRAEKRGIVLSSLRRREDERITLLNTLATLYTHGCKPLWRNLVEGGTFVALPLYPWQRQSYWVDMAAGSAQDIGVAMRKEAHHPLLGYKLTTAYTTWENTLDTHLLPYLVDHQVQKTTVFPAAGYIEMALTAAMEFFEKETCTLEQVEIRRPLVLSPTQASLIQTTIVSDDSSFTISSQQAAPASTWVPHVTGLLRPLQSDANPVCIDLEAAQNPLRASNDTWHTMTGSALYEQAALRGLQYGPCFQGVESVSAGIDEALGKVCWPVAYQEQSNEYHIHPILLDSCFQVIFALFAARGEPQHYLTHLPVSMERIRYLAPARSTTHIYSSIRLIKQGADYCNVDCLVLDEEGRLLMEITGMRMQAVKFPEQQQKKPMDSCLYETHWLPTLSLSETTPTLPALTPFFAQLQPELKQINEHLPSGKLYQQRFQLLEQFCSASLFSALRSLGWNFPSEQWFTTHLLREQLGILEQYDTLLTAFCEHMLADGILTEEQRGWRVIKAPGEVDPDAVFRQIAYSYPDCHADTLLAARCGRFLPKILRGEIEPLALLFGEEMSGPLGHFYESGLKIRRGNEMLQATLKQIVDQLPANGTLRILELGAGTGGTTTGLLPLLPADRVEYVFTDISEIFFQQAQQKYSAYPFVQYRALNIEQDPLHQGFKEQSFDLVIAANVLHATCDLSESLHHTRCLLKPGGLLCLSEVAGSSYWMLLIFGLLKSYWRVQDSALRPIQPLLRPHQWEKLLEACGFVTVVSLAHQQEGDDHDQGVFLAQAPDIVLQKSSAAKENTWLLFADETGVASQVQQRLVASAGTIVLVKQAEQFQRLTTHQFCLNPRSPADMYQLFESLKQEGISCEHILYLWGLDRVSGTITARTLNEAVEKGCQGVLSCIQGMAKAAYSPSPRLWIVTGGAQTRETTEQHLTLEQTPLYGLGRVLHNEIVNLRCTLIDIGAPLASAGRWIYHAEDIHALSEEFLRAGETEESEILLRGNVRYINRIVRAPLTQCLPASGALTLPDTSFRLDMTTPGVLDNLILRTTPRRRPGYGEVEIKVLATGLNFRDVMVAMGLIAGEALELGYAHDFSFGLECAGRVVVVGEGVTDFRVGDEVIAMGRHCFSAFVTTDAHLVMQKPSHISFEEATTLLTTFLTAHYALHTQGRLRSGERVLIHGGAGGVGLAAIQIVQQAGGVIFATAGSPEKRAYLSALGVDHVLDSRSLTFADEIMKITHGEGIDIVLNSVSGEAAAKSLSVLRRFGRFLEIGKRDFLENRKLGLRPFQYCLTYASIDLDQLLSADQAQVRQLMHEVKDRLDNHFYRPLPYRPFVLSQIVDAFRFMQQSKHIGKVVVTMQPAHAPVFQNPQNHPYRFRSDASYLITGGASGFGLATARWMVAQGARALVLINKSGVVSPEVAQQIEAMKTTGAEILVAGVDVTQEDQLTQLLTHLSAHLPPLRGVIHAAMVLDDSAALNMSEASLKQVIAPKAIGAWNLHKQTQELPLDFFILYSSLAATIGNPGQANYVAANMFLNELSFYRHARGLPSLTIEWGAMAQFGYIARHEDLLDTLARRGIRAFEPGFALELLGQLLQQRRTCVTAVDIDWHQLDATMPALWSQKRWAQFLTKRQEEKQEATPQEDIHSLLLHTSHEERQQLIQQYLLRVISLIVGPSLSGFDLEAKGALVLDSLMAMELRNSIQRDLGVDLPVLKLLQMQSVADVSTAITRLFLEEVPVAI
jgi:acyl transferase domain-containing protein